MYVYIYIIMCVYIYTHNSGFGLSHRPEAMPFAIRGRLPNTNHWRIYSGKLLSSMGTSSC